MKTATLITALLAGSLLSPAGSPEAAPRIRPPAAFSRLSLIQSAADGKNEDGPEHPRKEPLDRTLQKLSEFIGGLWVGQLRTPTRDILTEMRCEWAMNGRVIRARGVIDKGGPDETETESMFGWDPVHKNVYYIDFHGAQDVLKGTVEAKGNTLEYRFEHLVGPPARWRATEELRDRDTMIFTLFDPKGSEWIKRFSVEYKWQK